MKALWTLQPEYYFNKEVDPAADNIPTKTYPSRGLCSKFCLVPSRSGGLTPETMAVKPQCWFSKTSTPKGATAAVLCAVLAEDTQL